MYVVDCRWRGATAVDADDDVVYDSRTTVTSRHESWKTNALGWNATGYPFAS
jgi:hypothetical protein